jgi:hypothetical protein
MGKILFLMIIAALAWVLFKGLGKKSGSSRASSQDRSKDMEKMVKCHRCGVLMPESESMVLDGNISCHDPVHCLHRA